MPPTVTLGVAARSIALLAIVYFLTAGITVARFGVSTPIWFANAIAVVWLLQLDKRSWAGALAALWVVDSVAIALHSPGLAPVLAVADIAEIFLATFMIDKIGGARAALLTVDGLIRFIAISVFVPMISSSWGAIILSGGDLSTFFDHFEPWYAGTSLGLMIIGPALLVWVTKELRPSFDLGTKIWLALAAASLALVSAVVFSLETPAWLFILFPALLLLVWKGRLAGASIGSAVILMVGLVDTVSGSEAFRVLVYPATDISSQIQAFHLFLAALALSSLPLAVVLTDQHRLSDELARVAEARSEFLAAMSHEIRTPMTGVLGIVDLLEGEDTTPRQRRYIESIRVSGKHLLSIINDVLDFSRIETGKIELEDTDFSLPALLQQLRALLEPMALERQLALTFELPDGSPPVVKGDPTRIRQVLLNLIGNAIKFTPEGRVTLTVSHRTEVDGIRWRFRFEVRDTGIGIAPDQLGQLFSAFTQADFSTKRRFGGSGLGLAISKRLVEAMSGEIGVESTPGAGSTFWFEIPLAEGDAIRIPAGSAQPSVLVTPRRLLLAEDVELNRDIIRTMLERDGHQVVVAGDGLEAVNLASQSRFDMVLMDIHMPVMDGIEATRLIRDLDSGNRGMPILALTANVMLTEQEKCLDAGMDGVLMKPVEWDRLRVAIERFTSDKRSDEPKAKDQDDVPFAEHVFERVCELLPEAQLHAHIESLRACVSTVLDTPQSDLPGLEAGAHKIVSQAGMLGLMRLSTRAARVERCCRSGEGLRRALVSLKAVSGDVNAYLPAREKGPTKLTRQLRWAQPAARA